MSDWLNDLANKAKEKYQVQRLADETSNRQQLLEIALGRTFWDDLLAAVKQKAMEFDSRLGNYVMPAQLMGVDSLEVVTQFTKGTRNVVEVSYHPDRHAVGWGVRNGDPMGVYLFKAHS